PFASGSPATLTTIAGGLSGTAATIAFGNNGSTNLIGGTIDLSSSSNYLAFIVPSDGILSVISGRFSTSNALTLVGTTVTITAQVFRAPSNSANFTLLGTATLSPGLTGVLPVGTIISGSATGLNFPVAASDQLLMVFSANAAGISLINTISGYCSAGIEIQID